jgi:hypothetical protein
VLVVALEKERDDIVRRTIEGAIKVSDSRMLDRRHANQNALPMNGNMLPQNITPTQSNRADPANAFDMAPAGLVCLRHAGSNVNRRVFTPAHSTNPSFQ